MPPHAGQMQERFPLTSPQREIWFDQALHGDAPLYNIGGYMHIAGPLDPQRFAHATRLWVQRHDVLRTVLFEAGDEDGLPLQAYVQLKELAAPLHDFSNAADPQAAALAWMQQRMTQPFALYDGLLFTSELLKLSNECFYWFPRYHHLIADGWTVALLSRSLAEIYTALMAGNETSAGAPSYIDFIGNDRAYLDSPACDTHRRYWLQRYKTAPEALLAPRYPEPADGRPGDCIRVEWPRAWYDRLIAFAKAHDATAFHVILAALYVYFVRTNEREELVIGLPVLNRSNAAFKATAGLFVGVSPARFDFGVELSFRELLQAIGRELKQNYRHQRFPVSEINRAIGPHESPRQLFDLSVSYERQDYEVAYGGVKGRAFPLLNGHQQTPLTLFVREFYDDEPVLADFVFNRRYFQAEEIAAIQARFIQIVDFTLDHPDAAVKTIPLLTHAEIGRLEEWNRSAHPFPLDRSYAELFAQKAGEHPERIAAMHEGEALTYRELDRRADRLAGALRELGVRRGSVVALLGQRSLALLAMMVGVLKAGAAYLPLDVHHPAARLRDILDLAQAPVLLAAEDARGLGEELAAGAASMILLHVGTLFDNDVASLAATPPENESEASCANDLAYVIFTSGSTGQPKGAMIEQGGMLNNIFGKMPTLGLDAADRIAQTASPAFDISVWQFLAAPLVGATVHILPDEVVHDPLRLLHALESERISLLEIVPSLMRRLLAACTPEVSLSALRWVLPTGEALPPDLAQAWLARFPHIPLMNLYGPAECSDDVACFPVATPAEAQALSAAQAVPIGRPTPNLQLLILDRHRQPMPIGVTGEICIGGAGVGRGYLNDPEKTRAAFIDHPCIPGARLYRSGDLGRYRPDGVIEFMGRRDHQVKIHGQRIELGEIESRLMQHPAVREAVVALQSDPHGESRLAAYWAAHAGASASEESLRDALMPHLPYSMLPGRFVQMEALPLNANGKIDRKALPPPEWGEPARSCAAPQTAAEIALATIWRQVLNLPHVGRDDHFFRLGGHSLSATQVIAKLRQSLTVALPLRAVFEAPTLAALARRIDAARGVPQQTTALHRVPRDKPLPLSFSQARLWFLDQLEPGNAFYNVPETLRLAGPLDEAALAHAFDALIQRHEALRTVFDDCNGEPVQRIIETPPFKLARTDLSRRPAAKRLDKARRLAESEALRPFDLKQGPLIRARLLRLQDTEHWLLVNLHHIAADGWSMNILLRELAALYNARVQGRAPALAALTVQYADYSESQRQWLQGEALDRQLRHWRAALSPLPPPLELPLDHARPPRPSHRGAHLPFALPQGLTEKLHALSQKAGATLFMTLLGAFGVLLHRHGGQTDLCIGTPIANRSLAEVEPVVGCFVNTLALRLALAGNPSFERLLENVRDTALQAYAHQDLPFEKLVDALQPERHLRHAPLFQAMFALQNAVPAPADFTGLDVSSIAVECPVAKFDLTLDMTEVNGGLEGVFEYSTDLFERDTIERLCSHWRTLLESIAASPGPGIGELNMLPEHERAQLLDWSNRRAAEAVDTPTVIALFEEQVLRTPAHAALVFENEPLSYEALNARANRLAHALRDHGMGPDKLIGLCAERSLDLIAGILGILKAGAAYLPLDPHLPAERLAYLFEDARPALLLTQAHLLEKLPAHALPVVCFDRDRAQIDAQDRCNPAPWASHEHLAYVIYTSGSSGAPKGVGVTHRGLCSYAPAERDAFGVEAGQRVLQFSSLNFDTSISEIFIALLSGACLVLATREDTLAGPRLRETLLRHRIDILSITPSALALLAVEPLPVKTIIVGGERCERQLIEPWLQHHTVFNAYGPTEATVTAAIHRCVPGDRRHPPIGRPLANTRIYLLDAYLNPVPIGVAGELYIAGEGLARGYLGRMDLTAERFLPDPFGAAAGDRMYRSGDAARYRADGSIEYLGRLDHQVKMRGFRIELSEVEAWLAALPGIRQAVVAMREDRPGDKRLVAYVIAHGSPSIDAWRDALLSRLPDYMIPAHFVLLERFPLNGSGKIDRGALPAPDPEERSQAFEAPAAPSEKLLAAVWSALLGRTAISRNDHFFHCGGHSLLATRLIAAIQQAAGVDLPLRDVFEAPVLKALAARIDAAQSQGTSAVFPLQAVDHRRRLRLSSAQTRLWFLDQLEPGAAIYNVPLALRLSGLLDTAALTRSLNEILRRHEALRTTFASRKGRAMQVIQAHRPLVLNVEDISGLPQPERARHADRCIEQAAVLPFDLAAGPLLRAGLLRTSKTEHILHIVMHHIVCDAWSLDVLVRELASLYQAYSQDLPSQLAELPIQYADFAYWQRKWLRGAVLETQLVYWTQQLAETPALLELPSDRPRPAVQSHRGATHAFALTAAVTEKLHRISRDADATLFMTLATAFSVLLYRCSGQADICLGTPIANRRRAELEPLIGFFVNTLVLRTRCENNPGFDVLLKQVRQTALDAYAHQDLPFEQLVESQQLQRSLSHSPLFQVMFSLQNTSNALPQLPGLTLEAVAMKDPYAKFDLSLDMWEQDGALHGSFEYSTDLFEQDTIGRMAAHFATLLDAIASTPRAAIDALPLLTSREQAQVLVEWNRTQHDFPLDQTYASLFARQAARNPNRTVAVCEGEAITYRELDTRAGALARVLVGAGAGSDTLVALLATRGLALLTMMIAAFKAGAACLPLETRHPAQRLRDILALSKAPIVLMSSGSAGLGDAVLTSMASPPRAIIAEEAWRATGAADPVCTAGKPGDLAYVIFTSGSTGAPKGAMIEQRGMLNNIFGKIPTIGLHEGDRIAQTASVAFDIAVWQLLAAPLAGAAVHIFPDEIAHDPRALLDAVENQNISLLETVPSMMRAMLDECTEAHNLRSLRWLLPTGETLTSELAQAWFVRFPHVPLMNLYGPAECADDVAFHALRNASEVGGAVPIGRPTPNNQLFVLDRNLQPVPIGTPGEICVGGAGVGRGYLAGARADASAFIPHPFQAGARFYRTGDIGRWRTDGTLEFLGRRDDQVKIRGHRIEPGEIEAQLRRHPAVREALVIADESNLVAYWIAADAAAADAQALRDHLAQRLPRHMIPAHLILLDKLPLNANGKIDRRALPKPAQANAAYTAPCNPIDIALAQIWSKLLQVEQVGMHDDFFILGGHSLLATRLLAKIHKRFSIDLPLRAIFEAPTLAALSQRIGNTQAAGPHAVTPWIVKTERGNPLPLSFAQSRLWFLDQLAPGNPFYNMPLAMRIKGKLDIAAFENALNAIVRRHEILRTTYRNIDGVPMQIIADQAPLSLTISDLTALPHTEREAQAQALIERDAQRAFDLAAETPLAARLIRLAPTEHIAMLTLHHIASDEWSEHILMRELAALYDAFSQGLPSPLSEPPIQYADFGHWQNQLLHSEEFDRQRNYWKRQLAGAPALLTLPTDRPRPAVQTWQGGAASFTLPSAASQGLRALAHEAQATMFMTLITAFTLLLHRYSGQDDICVGTPVANRQAAAVESAIGFFVNTLVLRSRINPHAAFMQFLAQLRQTALDAYAHQDLPFEKLVEDLRVERSLSHTPLFQVMFVLEDGAPDRFAWRDLSVAEIDIEDRTSKFDLVLLMRHEEERLSGSFVYSTSLFDHATIERMASHFCVLLEAIAAAPAAPVGALPLLTKAERDLQLEVWNRTETALPQAPTIDALFAAQAVRSAPCEALVFEDERLSYTELNARANRLAHYLRRQGIGADMRVGLCLEPSTQMIVSMLGILKAGAAYVPLDPSLPAARLAYLVRDARPALLLTQAHLHGKLVNLGVAVLSLDAGEHAFADYPDSDPRSEIFPESVAYVLYTSGSTGQPKGVAVSHRSLCNLALAGGRAFGLSAAQRVLQFASIGFDVSVLEIFGALIAGCTLHLASRDALLPGAALRQTLMDQEIDFLVLTPSALSLMSTEPLPALKTLVVGSERCSRQVIAPWAARCTVLNGYGPTEAAVAASRYPCLAEETRHPPIGRPLPNTQLYVLDPFLNPVPIGVVGELHIAGVGLARGYLDRPDLTAESFIPNPFGNTPGARMYKTGDLVRRLADGNLDYVGRVDNQVKLRGFRIELGEIETRLTQLAGVRQAAVILREDRPGDQRLTAYFTGTAPIDAAILRAGLRETLPEYMIPAHFMQLNALPLNASDKLDRKALPPPDHADAEASFAPPRTPTETRLAAIWSDLLGLPHISRDANFFEIGGHSLLAVQLLARIETSLHVALSASHLFMSPTVAALALDIDADIDAHRTHKASLIVPLHAGGEGSPVFFIHPSGGTVFCYAKLAQALGAAHPCHAIQSPEMAGWETIRNDADTLCRLYAEEIGKLYPAGRIAVAGWSLGGALAMRVAHMLEQAGRIIDWVALFDTTLARDEDETGFEDFLAWTFSLHADVLGSQGGLGDALGRAQRYARKHGSAHIAALMRNAPQQLADESGIDLHHQAFLFKQYRVQRRHAQLMAGFAPGKVKAPLRIVWAEESRQREDWLAWTAQARCSVEVTLPGNHENVIVGEANVQAIVQMLCKQAASNLSIA